MGGEKEEKEDAAAGADAVQNDCRGAEPWSELTASCEDRYSTARAAIIRGHVRCIGNRLEKNK